MDMTTYLQEDIDWILNIARLPSHLIYNRFESLPKLLMSFSIYILLPPFWTINPTTKSKQAQVMRLESYFMVAEKGS